MNNDRLILQVSHSILSEFVTVISDPEMMPQVAGKKEALMCSVKGIRPEQSGS